MTLGVSFSCSKMTTAVRQHAFRRLYALAQSVHQIYNVCRALGRFFVFNGLAGGLTLHPHFELGFELIFELRGVEVSHLRVEDVGGEAQHLLGDPGTGHRARDLFLVAHLVLEAKNGAE
jgi:hypothetical protein